MRFVRWLLAIGSVVIVLGLAVACSSGKQKSDSASAPAIASGVASPVPAPPASTAADSSDQAGSLAVDTAGLSPAAVGRQVVSTATVTVRADDIAAAKQQAAMAAEAAGGFVYAEQGQYGDHPSVTVTLKVPPDHFDAVLASISKLGDVDSQQITTDDVTDQAIDLDSRIATAQVSVDRLRGFLDKATTVTDVASLESELLRRETDLEKLRAQKRALDSRVDLATIVLTVSPPQAAPVPVGDLLASSRLPRWPGRRMARLRQHVDRRARGARRAAALRPGRGGRARRCLVVAPTRPTGAGHRVRSDQA